MDGRVAIKSEPLDTGYNSNMSTNARQTVPALQPSPTRPVLLAPSRPNLLAPAFSQQTIAPRQWNPVSAQTVYPLVIQPQMGTSLLLQSGTLLQQRIPLTPGSQQSAGRNTTLVTTPKNANVTTSRTPPTRSTNRQQSVNSRNAKVGGARGQNSSSSLPVTITSSSSNPMDSIRIGYYGSITVLMYTPIADEEKSMCGLVYAARVYSASSQQEYMCNFCHYKHDKLSTFSSHVASHIFQCNHCAFKSFSRVELIAHKKDKHPEYGPEVMGFEQSLTSNGGVIPTQSNTSTISQSPSSLISALSSPKVPLVGDSVDKNPSAKVSKTNSQPPQPSNKQYFTFKLTEFANGYIKSLECEQCTFKTSSMGGLMSHATTHRSHDVNRDDNLVVLECLICRFASRHKKQVVAHICHVHRDQVQRDDEVRLRKLALAKTTSVASDDSEGEWLWGCYYCTFNSTDRELVLAHEGQEHRNSKLMITRKKLSADERAFWGVPTQSAHRHDLIGTVIPSSVGQTSNTNSEEPVGVSGTPNIDNSKGDDGGGLNKGGSRRKQLLPKRVTDNDLTDSASITGQANGAAAGKDRNRSVSPSSSDEFIGILVLDHIPEDLKMDVSGYIQYDESMKKGKCLSCSYHGIGCRTQLEEHVLQTHILCDIWKCPYCDFRNVRRFGVTRHLRSRHCHLPQIILRRKPFGEDQPITLGRAELNYEVIGHVSNETVAEEVALNLMRIHKAKKANEKLVDASDASAGSAQKSSGSAPRFRGPKTLCENRLLNQARKAWLCTYCPRRSVLKSVIYTHVRSAHPDKRLLASLKAVDRQPVDKQLVVKATSISDIKRLVRYDACIKLSRCNIDDDSHAVNKDDLHTDSDFARDSLALLGVDMQPLELVQGRRHSLRNLAEHRVDIKMERTYDRERSSSRTREDRVSKRSSLPSTKPEVSKTMHKCAYCEELNELKALRIHLKEKHSSEEPKVLLPGGRRDNYQYMCPLLACSFVSSTKKSLYIHLGRHPMHGRSTAYGSEAEGIVLEQEQANSAVENDVIQFDNSHDDENGSEAESLVSEHEEYNSEDDWQPSSNKRKRTKQVTPLRKRQRIVSDEQEFAVNDTLPKRGLEVVPITVEPQGQSDHCNDQKQLGCSYCTYETSDISDIKEHLTSSHTHKEAVAVDLLAKKSGAACEVYLCPLLFCNSQFNDGSQYRKHMQSQHPDVALIIAARHASVKENEDNDSDNAGASESSPRTLAARKAMLRNRRQEKAAEVKETSAGEVEIMKCMCPYCALRLNNRSAMKEHLVTNHAEYPPVCNDVDRMTKWRKNYRMTLCMKPGCHFFCYANNVLDNHACTASSAEQEPTCDIPESVMDLNGSSSIVHDESKDSTGGNSGLPESLESASNGCTGTAAVETNEQITNPTSAGDTVEDSSSIAKEVVDPANSEHVYNHESQSLVIEPSRDVAANVGEKPGLGANGPTPATSSTECDNIDSTVRCSTNAAPDSSVDTSESNVANVANGKSSDSMYQCSFCNWITSNEQNILLHVKQEHGLSEGGYAALGLGFGDDGRVIQMVSVRDKEALLDM